MSVGDLDRVGVGLLEDGHAEGRPAVGPGDRGRLDRLDRDLGRACPACTGPSGAGIDQAATCLAAVGDCRRPGWPARCRRRSRCRRAPPCAWDWTAWVTAAAFRSYLRSCAGRRVTTSSVVSWPATWTWRTPSTPDSCGHDDVVDLPGQLVERGVGGDAEHQHRDVVGAAGEHVVLDRVRQLRGDAVGGAADVADDLVVVQPVGPLDGQAGQAVGRVRPHLGHPGDPADRLLERRGHLVGHQLGRGARVGRGHGSRSAPGSTAAAPGAARRRPARRRSRWPP